MHTILKRTPYTTAGIFDVKTVFTVYLGLNNNLGMTLGGISPYRDFIYIYSKW